MLSEAARAGVVPVPRRPWPRRAVALTALSASFAGCAVAAMTADGALHLVADSQTWIARSLGLGIGLAVAAWMVLRRDPRHGVGLVLLVTSAGLSLAGLGQTLRELGDGAGAFMAGGPLAVLRGVAIFAQHGALAVLPLFYPGGRLPGRRWRFVLYGMAAAYVLYLAPLAWYGRDRHDAAWTSQTMASGHPWWGALGEPIIWMPRIVAVAAAVSLVLRASRSAQGLARPRLITLLICHATFWLVATVYAQLPVARDLNGRFWADLIIQGPSTIAIIMIAIVAAASVRLSPLVRMVRLLLVLEGLILGLWITYHALSVTIAEVAPAAGAAPAALSALALRPLARLLWRTTNLLFYGRRSGPDEAIRILARQLRDQHDSDEVAMTVCRTVVDRLGLPGAELSAPTRNGVQVLAAAGEPEGGAAIEFPLHHYAEHVGTLVITARPGEKVLDARDSAALGDLATQVAPVVAALRLRADLLASRERIVAAREEERRRLRRDLHDGLGPSLAGIRLRLDGARHTLGAGSPVAPLLVEASGETAWCLREIRQIIDDLRPPVLDDMGLLAALDHLATRFGAAAPTAAPTAAPLAGHAPDRSAGRSADGSAGRSAGRSADRGGDRAMDGTAAHTAGRMIVRTELPGALPALPAATEVAAYRIAAEALTNAVRHSGAGRIELGLAVAGPWLELRIADDGAGLPATPAREGVGLRSMAERAEEIGGTLALGGEPGGGTRVHARLPLHLP
ncbi:hypothetical protein GCM10022419_071410 [Nonomuraea rosea]|uniref:Histidine kinase domain-containing protein n=1 Tax=Nonomuraea rosea TaxID=638574 RepID=A0ABP6Y9Q3_9ACTN